MPGTFPAAKKAIYVFAKYYSILTPINNIFFLKKPLMRIVLIVKHDNIKHGFVPLFT